MIFITGSNGFLGSHLVKRLGDQTLSLLDRGSPKNSPKHRFLQAEINGISDYTAGLKGCNTVIHCAARVHIMDDS
ncbi:NAD-dependent epimerase/dehydratase family protein, partial [Vibrio parahaemolyticus]